MNKRGPLLMMLVAMAAVTAWMLSVNLIANKMGWDLNPQRPPQERVEATSGPATAASTTGVAGTPSTAPVTGLRVAAATQPSDAAQIGSSAEKDATYRMGVKIDSRGAGIDRVVLNEFFRAVKSKDLYTFQQPYPGAEGLSRPLGTRSLTLNGQTIDLSSAAWALQGSDSSSATYGVTIAGDEGPMARLTKTFRLLPRDGESQGYELELIQRIENLTAQPLKVRTVLNGPTVPPREQERGGDRQTLGGYLGNNRIRVEHHYIEDFKKDNPSKDLTADSDGDKLAWIGTASIYFNAIARPMSIGASNEPPAYIDRVEGKLTSSDPPRGEHPVAITLATTELEVAPDKPLELPLRAFFGPRKRALLNSDYYSAFPRQYASTLVLTSGPCAVCTWDWLVNLLVKLLAFFHWVFGGFAGHGDWGLAIIALVVLVRAILHPITKRSQISMAKMGKMGPEMERLKKKYGDNKDELTKAMWELQKQQGFGPYLGCLPMFLQMPIWIALWQSLQTTFELRQAPFLWGFTWIDDLSKPDHLIQLSQPLFANVWFLPTISGLNVLPIFMGLVFWLQMKIQPKPAAMTPEQAQQQKMMMIMMPFLFPLMLYSGPSGLNLYIMTSTLLGIIESKIVRDHIKQKEEAEKAGRVIVDAGKKFKGGSQAKKPSESEKPGGIMGWFQQLQERAEQIRREAEKKK